MGTIASMNTATTVVTTCVPVILFLLGFFGNLFNIIIFTRSSLIKSPCAIYLLGTSISSLLYICVISPLAIGLGFYRFDFRSSNLVVCRLHYMLTYTSMILSTWFTVLASFDRFCITSHNVKIRNLSRMSLARRLSIATVIIVPLIYSHQLVLFQIKQTPAGSLCDPRDGLYKGFFDFFYFATFSFIPSLLLTVAAIATIYQLRQSRTKMIVMQTSSDSNSTNAHRLKSKDRQLVLMILLQILAKVTLTSPHSIQKFYTFFVSTTTKDPLNRAIIHFITQLSRQLLMMNFCVSFFL